MPSERITQGRVKVYLGAVDLAMPDAPNITPAGGWTQIGESYLNDDGLTMTSSQELAFERILNEPLPVAAYRLNQDIMLAMVLKDFTAEVLALAFNDNSVTDTAQSGVNAGYRQFSLEMGTVVAAHAVLIRYESSPYDTPNVKTAAFNSDIWLPRAVEVSDFESVLSAKAPAMTPLTFQALKSDTAANNAMMRLVDAGP